jgi:hypothetical protein
MRAFNRLLGFWIAIFWVADAHAQSDSFPWNPKDSIRLSLSEPPSYSLWFDSKISTISGETVAISGYRYGIQWNKMSAYTGYYFSDFKQINGKNYDSYKFSYLSSSFEYKLYRTHRFGVTGFGQVGAGYRILRFSDNRPQQTRFMVPLEFGVNGNVRFLRYFGVSAGVGSRVRYLEVVRILQAPFISLGSPVFQVRCTEMQSGFFIAQRIESGNYFFSFSESRWARKSTILSTSTRLATIFRLASITKIVGDAIT